MARIDEAFRLAGEAMAAGMRYNSERVLQGSRQFRRGYVGPVTASEFMIGLAGELWAVWDGEPARAYGGTADVCCLCP